MENSTGELKQKELDGLYRALINEGVFDEEEREPDSKITKEQAVKYLLNSAGYRKFAELPGIFNNDFKDNKEINTKLQGYIAIAKSLKLINKNSKGMISPKKVLSRAEAVVIIYNYLMR